MEITSYLLGKKAGGGGQINLQSKEVEITENGETTVTADSGYDGLSEVEITTNVQSLGHDWTEIGYQEEPEFISDGYNYALQILSEWDNPDTLQSKYSSKQNLVFMPYVPIKNSVTNMSYTFYNCRSLMTLPMLNTSNIEDMSNAFYNCKSLKSVPLFDTSSVANMSNMFSGCTILTSVPQFNTASCENMSGMFKDCTYLTTIPQLNTKNVTNCGNLFSNCTNLKTLPLLDFSSCNITTEMFLKCTNLKELGGFKDIGKNYSTDSFEHNAGYMIDLYNCNSLTHDSMMNVINNLYDIASAGVQRQNIKIPTIVKSRLSASEIAIATNKGWDIITR